jgi:acyl carrier protein
MISDASAGHGMPVSAAAIEQVVIHALRAASTDKSAQVSGSTEVLQVVDSLGLMMGLANIQAALNLKLEPRETIEVLQARSVADVAVALEKALGLRSRQSV